MRRGEVWWAGLGTPTGSEPGFERPVLVISSDRFNRSEIRTVTVVALTSNERLAALPGNVRLSKKVTRLPKTSVANVSQIATINKQALSRQVGTLPKELMLEVEAGLRLALEL